MDSSHHQPDFTLSIQLSSTEAEGLAHLCHVLDWEFLAENSRIVDQAMEARYALAKLRFALSDAGFSAMPDKTPIISE
ncbi:MAG: hypothetical protein CVU32_00790 [Betaproteobacteria bacterium HGW-Betaproteobacteria-5]|jgi:hypothetical protein|nr:MAG: hypothetical protein CVU32_00790 [Betaproteobacteria bacterium HGW-Betaproteobacteria-5]PKO40742.1 MAG: hypothetical protein CVU33_01880 [Betaproteobacteria bacterium HGW-Betaproteobacteria-6]PKO90803.1 MAG: hypothetical protein CVU16_09075 [Betaproteobacteria bacterium HGW-Betaproteobacteria-10]